MVAGRERSRVWEERGEGWEGKNGGRDSGREGRGRGEKGGRDGGRGGGCRERGMVSGRQRRKRQFNLCQQLSHANSSLVIVLMATMHVYCSNLHGVPLSLTFSVAFGNS